MSKKYKIIKSDLCIAGKIYKEGSIVNFIDESLKNFFEPIPEEKVKVKPESTTAPVPAPIIQADEESPSISDEPALSFRPEGEILNAPSTETINQSTKKARSKKVTETI